MKKYVIAAILASIMGIMANPELLSADDKVVVTGVANLGVVRTITEINGDFTLNEVPNTPSMRVNTAPAPVTSTTTSVVTSTTATTVRTVADNIQIAGKTLAVETVADTVTVFDDHVSVYGNKFLFGHDSGAVFGAIKKLTPGATFSVTRNNVTTTYRVSATERYLKSDINSKEMLRENGFKTVFQLMSEQAMRFTYNAEGVLKKAEAHDLMLMTCDGTHYGNGDASHRFVIFADKI